MTATRTVSNLLEAVFYTMGTHDPSEDLAAADTTFGLRALQDMLADWAADGLLINYSTWESDALVVGDKDISIGENSADWDTVRPTHIHAAFIRASNYDYPVEIISEAQYRAIVAKTTQGRPKKLYYAPSAPNGTIYLYPAPSATDDIYINSYKPLTEPSELTDNILNTTALPREYFNALKWNLIMEMSSAYGFEPSVRMERRAMETLANLRSLNLANRMTPVPLEINRAANGRYCVLTD